MNYLVKTILAFAALVAATMPLMAAEGEHKLVLQISDNDPQKMNTVMNVAAKVPI